ncbi:hypothetical protein SAY87_000170 [Trapa incisa]|uniref:EamA domain-containing protein n=1 Tax=Trapa incisa TaxID=236973 RepID=A0AAN7GR92_9MYRT|nr:hypothetical protein SAY87_000170 [Trapa incisa]
MAAMQRVWNALHGMKAALVMVMAQCIGAGVNVFYKLAANDGMSLRIIVAYRFLFATAFMVPLALFFERKNRPKLSWTVLIQAFFCGLFGGTLAQNLYLESLALISTTNASALANLVPVMTFILAILFGYERLRLGTMAGKAKVAGTLAGIGGAMLLTFYKGANINLWDTHVNLLETTSTVAHPPAVHHKSSSIVLGSLLAIGSCLCYALWLIIQQAKMSESYPAHYSSTALMSLMSSLQAVAYALYREKDWSQWRLGWNIRLLAVSYVGIIGSGLNLTLVTWGVRMRGPLFVSVFTPLTLVLVALVSSLLLDEQLHLGCVLGSGLIVAGLYIVLWAKRKEMKKLNQYIPSTIMTNDITNNAHAFEIVVSSPMVNSLRTITDDIWKDECSLSCNPAECACKETVSKDDKGRESSGKKDKRVSEEEKDKTGENRDSDTWNS